MPVDVKYTTRATATGGREGRSRTPDGALDVKLSRPKELGGPGGEGTNPEQLFAAGYAACFLSALGVVARGQKISLPDDASVCHRRDWPTSGGRLRHHRGSDRFSAGHGSFSVRAAHR